MNSKKVKMKNHLVKYNQIDMTLIETERNLEKHCIHK